MSKIIYQNATFLLSVAHISQLPPDEGVEVAIVGRSNSGKSSVLNQITKNKNLARVSKTPGRTEHINLFALDKTRRFADLPGFGYAKVPLKTKQKWQDLIGSYLETRESLQGIILVMDIRHPVTDADRQFLIFSQRCDLPIHILLNKADKLSFQVIKKTLLKVKDILLPSQPLISFQVFSAKTGLGIPELCEQLDAWFL